MPDQSGTKCGVWTAVRSFVRVLFASIVSIAEPYTIGVQYFTDQSPAQCSHLMMLYRHFSLRYIPTEFVKASLSTGCGSSTKTVAGLSCNPCFHHAPFFRGGIENLAVSPC